MAGMKSQTICNTQLLQTLVVATNYTLLVGRFFMTYRIEKYDFIF